MAKIQVNKDIITAEYKNINVALVEIDKHIKYLKNHINEMSGYWGGTTKEDWYNKMWSLISQSEWDAGQVKIRNENNYKGYVKGMKI